MSEPVRYGEPPAHDQCYDLGKQPGPITFEFPEGNSAAQRLEEHLHELYGSELPEPARIRHALWQMDKALKKHGRVKAFVPKLGMLYAGPTGWELVPIGHQEEKQNV